MTTIASRCRPLLTGFATVAASALLAASASSAAAAPVTVGPGCAEQPVAQPFAQWGDSADYFLAPDGGFEAGGNDWSLRAGAGVTGGNEPFHVVSADDSRSLRLPAGGQATSAPFCIGAEHRTMRFFADAATSSTMNVDVLYADARGKDRTLRIAALSGDGAWAPTEIVPMVVNELAGPSNALSVRLRFTPHGRGAWTIDDVHVDPYRSR